MASMRTRLSRALISTISLSLLGAGLVVISPIPADAATDPAYNVIDRPANTVTADSLPTMQINGVVWDQAIAGDTVYAGGQFDKARPAGAAAGINETAVYNLVSFNIRTGVRNAGFTPNVNGRIRALALSPDKSRLYVVGAFTAVNGVTRSRVAAFNTSDGSLVASFAPNMSSDVFAVAATNTTVYLGGWFSSANGVSRMRLAAVNASNGATTAWAPTANSTVNTMTLSPDNSRVIVGGIFSALNGSTAIGLGSLDALNGTMYPFAANNTIQNYGNSAGIQSLKTSGGYVYGTAYWFGGTGNFEGMFQADPYTGAIREMADCHGDTYDASPMNGVVYVVSHHHDCSNINGFPDTNPRVRWKRASAFTIDPTTTVGHNTAGGYYDFNGQPAPSLVDWYPDNTVGTFTGQSQGGWTIESTNEYLVQGGEFPTVNNTVQQGLSRFAIPSIAPKKSGPRVNSTDSAPVLRGISGSSVRVSWPSNWDRDNTTLTYKLYRSDKGATPILTQTKASTFWNLPTQVFTDTGLTINTTYGYYVTATDPDGNVVKSTTTSITTGATVVDDNNYSKAVITDGASHYWRLDESTGATTSVDWANGNDLVFGTGVTKGAAGAVVGSPDTAVTFDGTANGAAGSTSTESGTDTFSIEAWIKTTSTSGGKIIGFGDSQLGTSSSYDRHVYLDNAGHLTFGAYPGGVRTVTTTGTYNDGNYHQVVATLSSAGMQLFVDGLLEATDESTTSAQGYNGYWRVGGDNTGSWPNAGSSQNIAGTIDDVSIYPTALTSTQVRNHYVQSGRTINLPSAPDDAYGKQVYADSPSFYWRLNESAGTTAVADSSQSRTPGTAFSGVTFGAASTVAPNTAAAFNGSDGTLATNKTFSNPRNYSEEIWFNTTTNRGGKLMGFGNQQSGLSGSYDRHVYMEDSGQLTYGVYTGSTNIITTPAVYNDGKWHHMVATQNTADGMKLYVDGALTGTNGQTDAQAYSGYWRVGGDSSWGGSSAFLNGTLDEAAVYPYALTADQVKNHYFASDASVNAAPVAAFTTNCTNLACYFDGSSSVDPDGMITKWAWTFGDGDTAVGSTTPHDYPSAGTRTATLTVTDNLGKTSSITHDVTVTSPPPNQAPVASFTSSCTERSCAFDASASSDADGTVDGYDWDFGDGSVSTEAKPTHAYTADGNYTVKLSVQDNLGAAGTTTKTVTVQGVNASPVAAFTATPTNLKVDFNAAASSDPDGTIASYAWTFGDSSTGTGVSPTHTYAAAGSYDVTLTVTDNKGAANKLIKTVAVTAPANIKPTAAFTTTKSNLALTVDASTSTDSDGIVASYAWSYGDNGTGTGRTDSHTYAAAGTYTVKLTVTDDGGLTDTVTQSVTVAAAPPTNVKPTASFTTTTADLKVSVDGASSTDTDGTVASYAWNYGDSGTGTGKTDSHTYAAAGTYTVKLTVTDDGGLTDTTTKSVTVAAPVSNIAAKDTFSRTGTRWGTADTGGAWTDSNYFTTNGSKGLITIPNAGSGPTAALNAASALNSTTTLEFSAEKMATGSGTYLTLSSRKIGTSEYRLKARLMADGTVRLDTAVVASGAETLLKEVTVSGLVYGAGDTLKVRFDVVGSGTTALSGKVWKASASEPAVAQISSTNTVAALQAAGSVAIQGYLSGSSTNAPVTLTVDNYLVTKN